MRRFRPLLAIVPLGILSCGAFTSDDSASEDVRVEALRAYAKLYGYVRYFHPSDEAADLDWDRFAVYGAGEVLEAVDGADGTSAAEEDDLRQTLEDLFAPIAPTVRIYAEGETPPPMPKPAAEDTAGVEFVAWQHLGVGSGPMYKSIRLNRPNHLRTTYGENSGRAMQSLGATPYRGRRVRLTATLRADVAETGGEGRMWLRVDRPTRIVGFFDNLGGDPVRSPEWRDVEITGPVAEDATRITFGVLLQGSGNVWADGFRLSVENEDGSWTPIELKNPGFEEVTGGEIPEWWGTRSPGYRITAPNEDPYSGERSLRIARDPTAGMTPFRGRLFDWAPSPGEWVDKPLGAGLRARIPVSLPSEDRATVPAASPASLEGLKARLDEMPGRLSATDPAVRAGDVAIAWNVFQHFYPYFDVVPTDWDAELMRALESALADESEADFLLTLRRLTAALHDGHAWATNLQVEPDLRLPPLLFGWVEGHVVVLATDAPDAQVGDRLVSVDGVPGAAALAEAEALVSGSPQWKRYQGLRKLGTGPFGTPTQIVLERDGETIEVVVERDRSQPPPEERPEPVTELEPGIWYVNLDEAPWPAIEEKLDTLAAARGVVFDLRGYPNRNHQILDHLLTEPDTVTAWMRVPEVIYPDFEKVTWQHHGWNVQPAEPHIAGKLAFITDGRAISYAESVMGFVEGYRLGEIVGGPTAGANGNVNFFTLPGGYSLRFTGMKVVKHAGSQQHLVGILPTVPAEPTLEGVREGRDELLEIAVDRVR